MSGDRSDIDVPASTLLNSDAVDRAPMPSEAPVERELSARDKIMARAVAKREAELEGEIKTWDSQSSGTLESQMAEQSANRKPAFYEEEGDRVYKDPYAAPEPEAETEAPAAERPARAAGASVQQQAPTQQQTFPIDVDGQQVWVTQDQMVHLARMGAIANQEVYKYNQQLHNPQPQPQYQAPAPVQTPVNDDPPQWALEAARHLQYGNEVEAARAIAGTVARVPQAPQVDLAAHERQIMAKWTAQQEFAQTAQIISQEYPDIVGNPHLRAAAAAEMAALERWAIANGVPATQLEFHRVAGDNVRRSIGLVPPQSGNPAQTPAPAGQTAPQASNVVTIRRSTEEIDARKRAAPQRTAAVIDRRSAAPEAPRQPTASDLVEQMRKQRGQSSLR